MSQPPAYAAKQEEVNSFQHDIRSYFAFVRFLPPFRRPSSIVMRRADARRCRLPLRGATRHASLPLFTPRDRPKVRSAQRKTPTATLAPFSPERYYFRFDTRYAFSY